MKNKQQRWRAAVAMLLFLGLSVAAATSWWNWPLIMAEHFAPRVDASGWGSLESLGQFGDMFGALNALFAGAAFLGVAIASYLQFGTLKAAREQQRLSEFEPMFFQLIGLLRDLLKETQILGWDRRPLSLSDPLVSVSIDRKLNAAVRENGQIPIDEFKRIRRDLLNAETQIVPVFNIIEQVMLLVDSSTLRSDLRLRHAEISLALFSDDLLMLTALFCFAEDRKALAASLLANGLRTRGATREVLTGRTPLQLQWLINGLAKHVGESTAGA